MIACRRTCILTGTNFIFFSFIYGEDVKFDDSDTVADFFHAAHKYNCRDTLERTQDYLMSSVDVKSSIIYCEIAHLCDIPELKKACVKVVTLSFTNLLILMLKFFVLF